MGKRLRIGKIELPRVEVAVSAGGGGERGKYNARRVNGYASEREARRAAVLRGMESRGEIRNLREQVRYELIPAQSDAEGRVVERACCYVADFVWEDAQGRVVVEDCKGVRTEVYRIKRKLMRWVWGIEVVET